jgi:SpoIID/LytB domain protein
LQVRTTVSATPDPTPAVVLRGSGWGHGVGMSQYGARAMALGGATASGILQHYYTGTQLGTRDTTTRIRVGVAPNVASTTVRASGGAITWQQCRARSGESPLEGRVTDCAAWFTQASGATLVACPSGTGVRFVASGQSCTATPVQSTTRPVARAVHHGTTLASTPQGGTARDYRHGWHDIVRRSDTRLNVVQDVDSVERYLYGLAEMPSSWPAAALQAQAIAGRNFALLRIATPRTGCSCQILASTGDQAYSGLAKEIETSGGTNFGALWVAAVNATAGQVVLHDGNLAQTFYSSSHGGRSENVQDSYAFGTTPIPYLVSVADPWSRDPAAANPYAAWSVTRTNADLAAFLSPAITGTLARVEHLGIRSRTAGGTPRELSVRGVDTAGATRSFTFTRPGTSGKQIAGAHLRTTYGLRSQQITSIGFPPFTDDDGSVHEYAIVWANDARVVQGVSATRFRPDAALTRGQAATMLYRTFALPAPTSTRFSDVPPAHTHRVGIDALAAAGVIDGFDDGTFRPDDPLTRAQMASLLARALDLPSRSAAFADVPSSSVHSGTIGAIAYLGITTGCTSDRFCPDDEVLRGQMASFLQRTVRSAR